MTYLSSGPYMKRYKPDQFHFKQFTVTHKRSSMKVGTDGVLLGAWTSVEGVHTVLDIGTGTGLIALMLAQRTSGKIPIDAVEISAEASADASDNFKCSPWSSAIQLHHLPIQKFTSTRKYDLIVSNPPYFINSFKPPDKQRELARHAEQLSLKELIDVVKVLLQPTGRLAVILPFSESKILKALAHHAGLHCIRECNFHSRAHKPIERVILEFSYRKGEVSTSTLCLYRMGEEWTPEYKSLTHEFYLKG